MWKLARVVFAQPENFRQIPQKCGQHACHLQLLLIQSLVYFIRRLRRLCGNFFTPEGIRRFVPQMCKIAKDHFMQHWEGRDEIFLGEMTKQFAFEVACFLFISMEAGPTLDGMNTAFTQVHGGLFSILPYQIPGTSFYKAMKGRKHIDQVSDAVIARRRQVIESLLYSLTV